MPLYETATAFADALEPKDPALADALRWVERVRELMPADASRFDGLLNKLRAIAP